ncbi:tRNA3(Ser)-specific nuclease WapA precursor [Planctomycetes bacterium CA13]|uniref:tRNA3(Ser)-specific nuclease WapA n=1 Tax=Novipirellula herctigrandis TaxID=2527986 RepID=A0A5C5ZC32_9BACT|nr:tRNA3(Ser)-specific nuclease WapA precursor [Planctomycetes bacterium CA13]
MVAFASSHRRTSKPKQCIRRKVTCTYNKAPAQLAAFCCYHRGQQYSIIGISDGGGVVKERYAYDAYGTPTILDAAGTGLTTSAEHNRYTYTGREYDEALGLYHYRARMYDSVAGRFCSRDPIGYVDGFNVYAYVNGMCLVLMDASGTRGCKCTCQPGMPDMSSTINDHVGKIIAEHGDDSIKVRDLLIKQTSTSWLPSPAIEQWLWEDHRDKMSGTIDDEKSFERGQFAPCISLCGQCVSTDKLGHFFEEGFIYNDVSKAKGDDKFAIGLGMWTEGLVPTDPEVLDWIRNGTITVTTVYGTAPYEIAGMFGGFADHGQLLPAGKADLAANESGMKFWKDFDKSGKKTKFSICVYVSDKWDEKKNPNVALDKKPF